MENDKFLDIVKRKRSQNDLSFSEEPSAKRQKKIERVVVGMGNNEFGQLGIEERIRVSKLPAVINFTPDEILHVAAGAMHNVCITKDGKVLTFGVNDESALGRETEDDTSFISGEVKLPAKAVQVTAGDSHSAALLENGQVYIWGNFRSNNGNMGLTPEGIQTAPIQILKDFKIVKISSGANHFVMLTEAGEVYTCGRPDEGQLGTYTKKQINKQLYANGGFQIKVVHLTGMSLRPARVITTSKHSIVFDNIWTSEWGTILKQKSSNKIYVCGLNNRRQLSLKEKIIYIPRLSRELSKRKWKMVCGGQLHTIFLAENGEVFSLGSLGKFEYGRLGLGERAICTHRLRKIPDLEKAINVAAGSTNSFCIDSNGDLYSWGFGENGSLGVGHYKDVFKPTKVNKKESERYVEVTGGAQHTLAIREVISGILV